MAKESAVTEHVPDQGEHQGEQRDKQRDEQAPARPRNRRGEGLLLREEIIRGATAIIVRTGSDQAVTLRSVAREVGIAAPSIYAHFPDRDAIIDAVVVESLGQLRTEILAAAEEHEDPVDSLLAGCAGYVGFGTREPARYRLLFGSPRIKNAAADCSPVLPSGLQAFQTLVDSLENCARAGRSETDDPFGDAVALWTALHGQVTLRAGLPDFPWPPTDTVEQLVRRLGRITPQA